MTQNSKLYFIIPDSYYEPEDEEDEDDYDNEFLHADARIEDREG